MKRVLLVSAFLLMACGMAEAQTSTDGSPLKFGMLDYAQRLSVAAVGRYDFEYAGQEATPTLDPGKQFTIGLQSQYLLTPMVTLTAGSVYLVDSKQIRSFMGFSIPFYGKTRPQAVPDPVQ